MRILYLIDPNSIHDIKWVSHFSREEGLSQYFICRETHRNEQAIKALQDDYGVLYAGTIKDFSLIRFYKTLLQIQKIFSLIRKYHIHLFHIQYAEPNALWCLFRWYFKVPIIITCRGTDVLKTIPDHFKNKNLINLLVRPAYRYAFKLADWVTTTSGAQMNSVVRFSGRKNNMSIIRTGVLINELNKDTSSYFPREISKPYILFPRYMKPLYNHEFCIKALALLPQQVKKSRQMVFIGRDSGNMEYQSIIEKLMLETSDVSFVFLSKQSQETLFELYKRADLIVMTPKSDGSPVTAMEAIALKKPVILGPLNYDESIFNPKTCKKLANWEIAGLTDAIVNILQQRSANKDEISWDDIDRDKNMKQLENIYKNLCLNTLS